MDTRYYTGRLPPNIPCQRLRATRAMGTNEAIAAGVRLVLVYVRARRARRDDRACGDDTAALAHCHSAAAGASHHHCGAAPGAARGWSLGKEARGVA
jgi:hypothetical protein